MNKIMFNDKYQLTEAVLQGTKTMTRRFSKRYEIGDIVAIAQPYKDVVGQEDKINTAGWNNKMFVTASLMPHHIKITNVFHQRLHEISFMDCLREGIKWSIENSVRNFYTPSDHFTQTYDSPIKAFAELIDKTGKKGDWERNPYVYVYEFELVD